jgi:hypothetical protein
MARGRDTSFNIFTFFLTPRQPTQWPGSIDQNEDYSL